MEAAKARAQDDKACAERDGQNTRYSVDHDFAPTHDAPSSGPFPRDERCSRLRVRTCGGSDCGSTTGQDREEVVRCGSIPGRAMHPGSAAVGEEAEKRDVREHEKSCRNKDCVDGERDHEALAHEPEDLDDGGACEAGPWGG